MRILDNPDEVALMVGHQPPEITNRGLRISLPVLEPQNPMLPTLVWISVWKMAAWSVSYLSGQGAPP